MALFFSVYFIDYSPIAHKLKSYYTIRFTKECMFLEIRHSILNKY